MQTRRVVRRAPAVVALGMMAICFTLTGDSVSSGQEAETQAKYVIQAAARLNRHISKANMEGFVLADDVFSIGGGWLKQSENNWITLFNVTLNQGRGYRLVAAGDNDAVDVDLRVLSPDNRVVVEDAGTQQEAIVTFVPTATQKYAVQVRLYASKNNLPCATMAVVLDKK